MIFRSSPVLPGSPRFSPVLPGSPFSEVNFHFADFAKCWLLEACWRQFRQNYLFSLFQKKIDKFLLIAAFHVDFDAIAPLLASVLFYVWFCWHSNELVAEATRFSLACRNRICCGQGHHVRGALVHSLAAILFRVVIRALSCL